MGPSLTDLLHQNMLTFMLPSAHMQSKGIFQRRPHDFSIQTKVQSLLCHFVSWLIDKVYWWGQFVDGRKLHYLVVCIKTTYQQLTKHTIWIVFSFIYQIRIWSKKTCNLCCVLAFEANVSESLAHFRERNKILRRTTYNRTVVDFAKK